VQHRRVIADIGAIEGIGDARLEDVISKEKGNRESQDKLGRFGEPQELLFELKDARVTPHIATFGGTSYQIANIG
jgi:hypothetical protein